MKTIHELIHVHFYPIGLLGAVIDPKWTQWSPGRHPPKHSDNQWRRLVCFIANSLRTHLLSSSKSSHRNRWNKYGLFPFLPRQSWHKVSWVWICQIDTLQAVWPEGWPSQSLCVPTSGMVVCVSSFQGHLQSWPWVYKSLSFWVQHSTGTQTIFWKIWVEWQNRIWAKLMPPHDLSEPQLHLL